MMPGVVVHLAQFFVSSEMQRAISFTVTAVPISQVPNAALLLMPTLCSRRGHVWTVRVRH